MLQHKLEKVGLKQKIVGKADQKYVIVKEIELAEK